MQLFSRDKCIDIYLKNTNKYVRPAVEDLRNDFKRVSACGAIPQMVDQESDYCIIIEENTTDNCEPIESEGFAIKSENGKIIISADSYLGTMWGIYTFSEKYLGVDPCYIFNDLEIEKREALEVELIDMEEKPKGFGFRGVFINDEDLLTGWKDGGGIRYLDFSWYGLTVDKSVIELVVETILRLKLNLVIPASFLDIDNPPEKLLADCVAERGIFLSQHHLEPLGVSAFTFENYCKRYHKTGEFSYLKCPELMDEVWNFYAEKWSQYDNVVWQIGLRGKGDRPVWNEDIPTDEDLREYGKFISCAMACQKDIVLKATEGRAKYFTSTLWMEGSTLMEKGVIDVPQGTIMVFADTGPNQMYSPDFYNVPRLENVNYGIYYHLQYYCCGPHLAPQTGLDKLYYNVKLAKENGDSSYFIVNASNIREFVFELGACAKMLYDIDTFSKEAYLDAYCQQYHPFADEAKRMISEYYNGLPEIDVRHLSKHHEKYFNYSFREAPRGIKNFVLKEGNILEHGDEMIVQFHKPLEDRLYIEFYDAIKASLPQYVRLCGELKALSNSVSEPLKKHIEVKWLLYASTLRYIYEWYLKLYEAKRYCDLYESAKMKASLTAACESLEAYLNYRKCAEYGIFESWYRGDLKMNVKQRLYDTKRLLGQTPNFC